MSKINAIRMEYINKNGLKVLRYKTGSFPHWLLRQLCIAHDISYGNVIQCRINDGADHWALIVRNDKPLQPFTDEPLLP